ncbi:MAG TPA: pyridoxamine 5'-phosphate oxidase family protein [Candidatus Acidoferrum sp.]|nr:pyridoxamine 5'-phosphate oxidase family protein [Candidatus Acidoferrum sp.]
MPRTGQAPPLEGEEIESVLKEARYARICTHNKDGTIHVMPVGYRYLNGQIMFLSLINSQKNKNIERNNQVSVLVDTPDPLRGVLIYGTAEIDYEHIYDQTFKLLETSPIIRNRPRAEQERITKAYIEAFKGAIVKVTPKRMVTFDYAKDEAWNNFLKTYIQK